MITASGQSPPIRSLGDIQDFYARYVEALDEERFDAWPGFFSDDCVYQVITRENFKSGFPLCVIRADGKGMLLDRIQGVLKTQMYRPRTCRRFNSGIRLTGSVENGYEIRQNVMLIETLDGELPRILICGVSYDRIQRISGELYLQQRVVVADHELIDNSLIFPV